MEPPKTAMEVHGVPVQKPNYMLMSLQRILVLVIIFACVLIVVRYTPMPEEYFENCDRECHELDWPMICRVKLVIEVYKTLSKSCGNCTDKDGTGECPSTCISADGRERGVLTANRALPAPTLHVCHNDILVVDVVHRAPAHALSIHWRGQPQKETPFMDGAPMLTQCPQPAYTTFQYKFRASAVGTHMYHAHSAADAADGLAGALVVRQSPRQDPLRKLYDTDASEHTIYVSEWGHSMGPLAGMMSNVPKAESLLINGKGKTVENIDAPLTKFSVEYGKRYRFRLAYGGGSKSCPIQFSIEKHVLTLVALDGNGIEPEYVNSIELGRGERVDFILEAKRAPGVYKMSVVAHPDCQDNLKGVAELVYTNKDKAVLIKDIDELNKVYRKFSTVISVQCEDESVLCLTEARGYEQMPSELTKTPDRTLYVPFNYSTRRISAKRVESWGQSDGHRFTYPASPLLTQGGDVGPNTLCPEGPGEGDECVHVKNIPLYSTVEIVMFDQGGESDHIFHLHGYSFYVTGVREFNRSLSKETVIKMNEANTLFINKNLIRPVLKDTIVIPKFGVVALRFKADNPGYWMMRDERSTHWTRGLDFILKVGEQSDLVQAPPDFPKCGSYVGPEYFLI
ncbi:laccase-2-like isoform X1 [Bombyx mandarina]|uniref:Laccase-2-like isoform X1 n=2 Tax=Bombyx mandarina TaxID=7092 RepID=A0A6J2K983_BOMMA|nr:laccase-2-like isoform X1 [Bombyx mandarina]